MKSISEDYCDKLLKELRNFYRNNFTDGKGNASFLLWIELKLSEQRKEIKK